MLLKTCEIPKPINLYFFSLMLLMLRCLNRIRWRAFSVIFYCIRLKYTLFRSLDAAANFERHVPFVNPARISPDDLLVGDYKHLIWPHSKQNAVFTMLGAVTSCHIINSTTIGSHNYRAVTIIPYGPSFAGFTSFLGKKYSCDNMFGPFDFGCLLTFSSRREGLSSSCLSTCCCIGITYQWYLWQMGLLLMFRMLNETWRLSGPLRMLLLLLCGLINSSLLLLILIKKVRALALIFITVKLFNCFPPSPHLRCPFSFFCVFGWRSRWPPFATSL